MNETLNRNCNLFFANRKEIKEVFAWENDSILSVCAAMITNKGQHIDRVKIKACKDMLKAQTGIFSNFRGNIEVPMVCMMALSENPAQKLAKSLQYYNTLKGQFRASEYLVLAASILADSVSDTQISGIVARANALYKLMKEEHPFLTSSEDSVSAVMMAVSDKTDDLGLIRDAESAYQILKQTFSSGNDVQSVAFVLALADGNIPAKCEKLVALYNTLKAAGIKYGKYYELSTLAALSLLPVDVPTMVNDIAAVDSVLALEKPYKGLFGLERKTRLMHAAMLVSGEYASSTDTDMASVTSTLAMVAAQQAALCAVICASSVAASAAASSN